MNGPAHGSILFVGDIHNKADRVCPVIEQHLRKRDIRTIVLLGDMLNDWDSSASDETREFIILHDHVLAWRQQGIDAHVLLGNHDVIYLFPPRGRETFRLRACSPGYRPAAHGTIHRLLMELEPEIAYGTPLRQWPDEREVLCTHAGVTNDWMEWCHRVLHSKPDDMTAVGIADWLNRLFRDHPMAFMERIGEARGGGYHHGISPLWADRTETEQQRRPRNIIQIVGHTPVPTITAGTLDSVDTPGIRYCDTMSDDSHGNHLGDGSMLLYDDETGRFTVLPWPDGYTENNHATTDMDAMLRDRMTGDDWLRH